MGVTGISVSAAVRRQVAGLAVLRGAPCRCRFHGPQIHYFIAYVHRSERDPEQNIRQELYLRAIASTPGVELHFGKHIPVTRTGMLITPSPSAIGWPPKDLVTVSTFKEKGSDVNLAVRLVDDAWSGEVERAIVVSNDTDLIDAIRVARRHIRVDVVSPQGTLAKELKKAAAYAWSLDPGILQECRMPIPKIGRDGAELYPPASWMQETWPEHEPGATTPEDEYELEHPRRRPRSRGAGLACRGWLCNRRWRTLTPERLIDRERETWADSILMPRLVRSVARLNPGTSADEQADAIRRALQIHHPTTIENNRAFHHLMVNGVDVPWRDEYGNTRYRKLRLIDLDNVDNNEWLALQQFTVEEKDNHRRRPDVVIFANGIPFVVIELKQPTEGNMVSAWNQLQTYIADLPNLMRTNFALVASNGFEARMGSITAGIDRFMPWRSIDGDDLVDRGLLELRALVKGALTPARILDLLRSFVLFEEERDGAISKKIAGYHQYFAVNRAVERTWPPPNPMGTARSV